MICVNTSRHGEWSYFSIFCSPAARRGFIFTDKVLHPKRRNVKDKLVLMSTTTNMHAIRLLLVHYRRKCVRHRVALPRGKF
jgi:hypothetical protein